MYIISNNDQFLKINKTEWKKKVIESCRIEEALSQEVIAEQRSNLK